MMKQCYGVCKGLLQSLPVFSCGKKPQQKSCLMRILTGEHGRKTGLLRVAISSTSLQYIDMYTFVNNMSGEYKVHRGPADPQERIIITKLLQQCF